MSDEIPIGPGNPSGEYGVSGHRSLPALSGSGTAKLKAALLKWRAAEKAYAHAVLAACHPRTIREFSDDIENALHKVRVIVDSEPWAEISSDESPNSVYPTPVA